MKLFGYEKALTNTGFPYGGGLDREFDHADVRFFGKVTSWGTRVINFWVVLTDGTWILVNGSKQEPEAEKWLRKLSKKVPYLGRATRDVPWRFVWVDAVTGAPVERVD